MNFSDIHHELSYEIFGEDNLEITFYLSRYDELCKIFYITIYIDKLKYFFVKNEISKFFGGIPENLTNNFNKFTFNKETEKLSEIKFELNNGTNLAINKNKDLIFRIDKDTNIFIRLPEGIFNIFEKLFFKDAKELSYYNIVEDLYYCPYYLNESQKNFQNQYYLNLEIKILY